MTKRTTAYAVALALVIGGTVVYAWPMPEHPAALTGTRTWVGFTVAVIGVDIALVLGERLRAHEQQAGQSHDDGEPRRGSWQPCGRGRPRPITVTIPLMLAEPPREETSQSARDTQRAELFQIYVMERQDIANGQIVVLAIIAAALTYIVASAGFLIGHYTKGTYAGIPSVILLGSPLVTLALLSSLVVTVSTNAMRVKHLKKLESLLNKNVATGIALPSAISDFADIWEIRVKPSFLRVYTLMSLATYVPIFAVSLGYILVVLVPGPWPTYKAAVFALYCFVMAMQATGVLVASLHKRFKTLFVTPPEPS